MSTKKVNDLRLRYGDLFVASIIETVNAKDVEDLLFIAHIQEDKDIRGYIKLVWGFNNDGELQFVPSKRISKSELVNGLNRVDTDSPFQDLDVLSIGTGMTSHIIQIFGVLECVKQHYKSQNVWIYSPRGSKGSFIYVKDNIAAYTQTP